jgi:hypothetical protein
LAREEFRNAGSPGRSTQVVHEKVEHRAQCRSSQQHLIFTLGFPDRGSVGVDGEAGLVPQETRDDFGGKLSETELSGKRMGLGGVPGNQQNFQPRRVPNAVELVAHRVAVLHKVAFEPQMLSDGKHGFPVQSLVDDF